MHNIRQQRPEHLICSKFYFSNNHKRYPITLQINAYKSMQDVNRKSQRKETLLTILIYEGKAHRNAYQELSTYG
jgi:hypothetical protein